MSSSDDALPDRDRRRLLERATSVAGGLSLAAAAYPFLASLAPSERARAQGAPVEADLARIALGELTTIDWRGRPVWILRRTPQMLATLERARPLLTDPDSRVTSQQPDYARNATRSIRPEVFVAIGLCTHLGCVPTHFFPEPGSHEPNWPGGWYCPCHGSKFDLAGRVFKNVPAPTNLVVPPHVFVSLDRLTIGTDEPKGAAA